MNRLIQYATKILNISEIIVEDNTGKIVLIICFRGVHFWHHVIYERREIVGFFNDLGISKRDYRDEDYYNFGGFKLYYLVC